VVCVTFAAWAEVATSFSGGDPTFWSVPTSPSPQREVQLDKMLIWFDTDAFVPTSEILEASMDRRLFVLGSPSVSDVKKLGGVIVPSIQTVISCNAGENATQSCFFFSDIANSSR
jgi:hypothetical protein